VFQPVGQHPVAALGQDRLWMERTPVDRQVDVLHTLMSRLGARGHLQ